MFESGAGPNQRIDISRSPGNSLDANGGQVKTSLDLIPDTCIMQVLWHLQNASVVNGCLCPDERSETLQESWSP